MIGVLSDCEKRDLPRLGTIEWRDRVHLDRAISVHRRTDLRRQFVHSHGARNLLDLLRRCTRARAMCLQPRLSAVSYLRFQSLILARMAYLLGIDIGTSG